MMSVLLGCLVTLCLSAFLLPMAKHLIMLWVRAYTWRLPRDVRERRLAELESDLFEQSLSLREEGLRSPEIGLRLLLRAFSGVPADVPWARSERRRFHHRVKRDSSISKENFERFVFFDSEELRTDFDRFFLTWEVKTETEPGNRKSGVIEFPLRNDFVHRRPESNSPPFS